MAQKATTGLKLEVRAKPGTTGARKTRAAGRIPGVLYGHGQPPVAVAVDAKALGEVLQGSRKANILDISFDGTKDTAIIRTLQRDPVTRRVVSIDLQRVSRTEIISATLPIVTVGTPRGVREMGGVLDMITRTIDVSGPADSMPDAIRVDVNELGIHEHVSAKDLVMPPGLSLRTAPETTIVAVEPSKTEREAEADLTQATPEAVAPVEGATEATPEAGASAQ